MDTTPEKYDDQVVNLDTRQLWMTC